MLCIRSGRFPEEDIRTCPLAFGVDGQRRGQDESLGVRPRKRGWMAWRDVRPICGYKTSRHQKSARYSHSPFRVDVATVAGLKLKLSGLSSNHGQTGVRRDKPACCRELKSPTGKENSESILASSLAGVIARWRSKRRQRYQWAGRLSFEKPVAQDADSIPV